MLFNAGQSNEAIYTNSKDDSDAMVLAFEDAGDATQYAQVLLDQGFDLATPSHWSANQLLKFCQGSGFAIQIVNRGNMPDAPSNTYERPEPPMDPGRNSAYVANQRWLEGLFSTPNYCGDDDCLIDGPGTR